MFTVCVGFLFGNKNVHFYIICSLYYLQQACKIDNLQQVCDVFGCVQHNNTIEVDTHSDSLHDGI